MKPDVKRVWATCLERYLYGWTTAFGATLGVLTAIAMWDLFK